MRASEQAARWSRLGTTPGHPGTTEPPTCSTTSGLLSVGMNTSPRWVSECSS